MPLYRFALKAFEAAIRSQNENERETENRNTPTRRFNHQDEEFHRNLLMAVRDHQEYGDNLERSLRLRLTDYFQENNPRDSSMRCDEVLLPISFRERFEHKIFRNLVRNRELYSPAPFRRCRLLDGMADHASYITITSQDPESLFRLPKPCIVFNFQMGPYLEQSVYVVSFMRFLDSQKAYVSLQDSPHNVLIGLSFRNFMDDGVIALVMESVEDPIESE